MTDIITSLPKDSNTALTFCLPFYGGLGYLSETLDSVRAQTIPGWQCIVVDDASPEPGAQELVESFRERRVRYIRNATNLGLAGNWNRCLELADTPFVTLLHTDDRLQPHYAETMLSLAARHPNALALFCRAKIIDASGASAFSLADRFKDLLMPSTRDEIVLHGEDGLARIMRGNFVFCPSLCYRLDRLRQPAFDASWRMVLDLEWLTRELFDGHTLVGSPTVAYEYRRHAENQTSILTRSMTRFHEEIALQRSVATVCRTRGWTRAAAAADGMLSVRLHLLHQAAMRLLRLDVRQTALLLRALQSSLRSDPRSGRPSGR